MEHAVNEKSGEPNLPYSLKRVEILEEQRSDDFCQTDLVKMAPNPKSPFFEDLDGILCLRDQTDPTIVQIVLPTLHRPRVLQRSDLAPLIGYPGQTRMNR